MKERIIKVLQVTRKFGFIMAAVMIFPYVSSFPAVIASDGESTTEAHEVSVEDLEHEYSQLEEDLLQENLEIDRFYSRVSDELGQYIVEVEENIYELVIPDGVVVDFTEEELEMFKSNLQVTNQMMKDGLIIIDENGDYYTDGDDDFYLQSIDLTRYTYNKYKSVNLLFKTIQVWYGIDIGLTQAGSLIIGGLLFGGGYAASWASTAVIRTKVNQFFSTGREYYVGSVLDKVFTYLTNIGISNALLNNIFGAFNESYVNVGIIVDLLSMFATVFMAIKSVLMVSGGPFALFLSSVFAIAGGQLIGAGINCVAGGLLRGRSVVKFRLPLTLSAY